MVKLRARCLVVGDAAVGKSALCHIFYSDGTLFQKNYSMTTGVELIMKCVNIPETNDSVELYIIDSAGKETLVETCEKMSVVASAILYAVACWGSSLRARDINRLNRIIKKAGHVVGEELDSLTEVSERSPKNVQNKDNTGLTTSHPTSWGQPSLLCLVFDLTSEQSFANCICWMERVGSHCPGLRIPGVLVGNKSDLSARREVQASVAKEWAKSRGLDYHETSAKEMENCDIPFRRLAQAFHSIYKQHCGSIQNLSPG